MSELFNEVDEDVRREQLKKLWDQYSIYLIAGALLIIAAVGGWRGYQYLEAKKAAEAGAAFDKASNSPSEQARRGRGGLCRPRRQGAVGISRAGAAADGRRSRNPRSAGCREDVRRDCRRSQRRRELNRIWREFARPNCCWKVRPIPT